MVNDGCDLLDAKVWCFNEQFILGYEELPKKVSGNVRGYVRVEIQGDSFTYPQNM